MSANWRNWCRLCANDSDTTMKVEITAEMDFIIGKILTVNNICTVCVNCFKFLNEINNFSTKSKSVEMMFLEIMNSEDENLDTLNALRQKFGLHCVDENQDYPDVSDSIKIKEEMLMEMEESQQKR
jgi:hypothetical protein